MSEIELLAVSSEMAKKYGENYEVINFENGLPEEFSFHPNGKSGVILPNDDYFFNIRCNHLMWVEGGCENIEGYWEDGEDYDAILIYGNHKGYLSFELIVFHNK
jgi:hypothetical protein